MAAEQLHANTPRVVHETIDGEVILIDLATGTYFSLQGGAANVWALIASGHPTPEIVEALAEAYNEEPGAIHSELDPFLAQLQSECLVTATSGNGTSPNGVPDLKVTGAFSAQLEKHTDMTELILLDPVHDVDSIGWPNVPPGQDTTGT